MARNRRVRGGADPDALEELLDGPGGYPRALALDIGTNGRRPGLQPSGSVTVNGDVFDVEDLAHDPCIEAARIRRGPFDNKENRQNG